MVKERREFSKIITDRLASAEKLALPWVDASADGQTKFGLLAIRRLGTVIDIVDVVSENTQEQGVLRVARQEKDSSVPGQLIFGNSEFEEIASVTLREDLTFGERGADRITSVAGYMSYLNDILTGTNVFSEVVKTATLTGIAAKLISLGVADTIIFRDQEHSLSQWFRPPHPGISASTNGGGPRL